MIPSLRVEIDTGDVLQEFAVLTAELELTGAADRAGAIAVEALQATAPVLTGRLRASATSHRTETGSEASLNTPYARKIDLAQQVTERAARAAEAPILSVYEQAVTDAARRASD